MKATRKEWIGLAVIALPCLLYSMDLTVLHMAVPQLSRDLDPSSTELLWIIDIYGFMVAGFLIAAGTLGDRIGRRKLLMIGAAMFGVASVAAAYSRTAEMLIVTRALLGIAGATVAPSTLSLIRNMFHDEHERTRAISVWITAYSLGGIVGPLIGGVLLERFFWGSVFLIAVPPMALLLVVGPMLLPEYKDPQAGLPDFPSALLSLGAVLAAIFGIKRIAADGLSAEAVATLILGAFIAVVFVRRQLRLADPLIDLRLFRAPGFSASLATYGVTVFMLFGGFLFIPQYLQLVKGLSPLTAGLWSLPWAIAFVVASLVTPPLTKRYSRAGIIAVGLLVSVIGSIMVISFDAASSFLWFATSNTLVALGSAPVITLTTDIVIGSAPPERAGAAGAISETSAEFGGAVGIAIFGSIGVAAYRLALGDALPPELPATVAESVRSTLGAAVEASAQLPEGARGAVLESAREAFLRGLRTCAIVSAVGISLLAPFAWFTLRRRNVTT
ncbi:MAG TPA: MFS transporter [Gemmatimonadaceae bacterium]|nr:MFS transporter [Gemmatimonadaceae bacterium]